MGCGASSEKPHEPIAAASPTTTGGGGKASKKNDEKAMNGVLPGSGGTKDGAHPAPISLDVLQDSAAGASGKCSQPASPDAATKKKLGHHHSLHQDEKAAAGGSPASPAATADDADKKLDRHASTGHHLDRHASTGHHKPAAADAPAAAAPAPVVVAHAMSPNERNRMTQMQQHSSSSSPAAGGASKSSHTLEQPPSLAHASSAGLPHGHHEHKSHHHDKPHGVDRHHKHAGEKDEKKHTKDDSETPESPAAGVPVLPLGDLAHAEDDHAPSSYRTVSHLKVHEMPLLGSRPSTPSGGHSAQPIPVEAIYRHYAGSDSEQSRLGPKGLKVLAEDVFDEFCVRYKKKLQEVTHPKDGSEYTEGQCETDLWTDLPFLLPCHPHGHTTPTREEYVTYIAKVCQREMKRSAAAAPDHSVSGSSHGHSASQLRITRTEFLTGWRHCAALLVAEMERVKDSEAKESPCKLM